MRPADMHLEMEELSEPLSVGQQQHLARCSRCTNARASLLSLREAVRSLPSRAPPPGKTLLLLAEVAHGAPSRASVRRSLRAIAATFAALALLGGGIHLASRRAVAIEGDLAQEIALDHLHYQHRRGAAEVTGTAMEIANFFERTLSRRPYLPPVEATQLIGGKRCRIGGVWSALVWLERAGEWLSLFSLPATGAVRQRGCVQAAGVYVCGTADPHGGSRILVGRLPPRELLRLLEESLR